MKSRLILIAALVVSACFLTQTALAEEDYIDVKNAVNSLILGLKVNNHKKLGFIAIDPDEPWINHSMSKEDLTEMSTSIKRYRSLRTKIELKRLSQYITGTFAVPASDSIWSSKRPRKFKSGYEHAFNESYNVIVSGRGKKSGKRRNVMELVVKCHSTNLATRKMKNMNRSRPFKNNRCSVASFRLPNSRRAVELGTFDYASIVPASYPFKSIDVAYKFKPRGRILTSKGSALAIKDQSVELCLEMNYAVSGAITYFDKIKHCMPITTKRNGKFQATIANENAWPYFDTETVLSEFEAMWGGTKLISKRELEKSRFNQEILDYKLTLKVGDKEFKPIKVTDAFFRSEEKDGSWTYESNPHVVFKIDAATSRAIALTSK